MKERLRTGFTTGTCATAGAKAGLLALINRKKINDVEVRLPKGNCLKIKIESCKFSKDEANCIVIKDGGDDPDVTHGAQIVVDVSTTTFADKIEIVGGKGVGIVTKPGLGLEINQPAINPVPKKMIIENLKEIGVDFFKTSGLRVKISVPKGEELAKKTDNPRLGIVRGISILGTSGIVIPYSTASFAASIRQNLDVALAMGNNEVVLTTGGRSEDFSKKIVNLPDHCFVKMGDFSGYTIQECQKKGIKKAYIFGFIGKLTKMAGGVKQTHVKGSKVDMNFLAGLVAKLNSDEKIISQIRNANTARHVLEIIKLHNVEGFFDSICENVYRHMRSHSKERVKIEVILFDFDGTILSRFPK